MRALSVIILQAALMLPIVAFAEICVDGAISNHLIAILV